MYGAEENSHASTVYTYKVIEGNCISLSYSFTPITQIIITLIYKDIMTKNIREHKLNLNISELDKIEIWEDEQKESVNG